VTGRGPSTIHRRRPRGRLDQHAAGPNGPPDRRLVPQMADGPSGLRGRGLPLPDGRGCEAPARTRARLESWRPATLADRADRTVGEGGRPSVTRRPDGAASFTAHRGNVVHSLRPLAGEGGEPGIAIGPGSDERVVIVGRGHAGSPPVGGDGRAESTARSRPERARAPRRSRVSVGGARVHPSMAARYGRRPGPAGRSCRICAVHPPRGAIGVVPVPRSCTKTSLASFVSSVTSVAASAASSARMYSEFSLRPLARARPA
jgi:hypothetical protein